MKDKVKSLLIDLGLLLLVFFLVLIFHTVFIAGPIRVMEHEDQLYVQAFSEQESLPNLKLLNRFALSKIYYIAQDQDNLYYFDQDLQEKGQHVIVPIEYAISKAKALGFDEKHISYGVFNEQIVFNLEKKKHIVYLDINNLDILFEFGG